MLRRFDIINFPRRFDHVADTTLDMKLKSELSGILNLILSQSLEIIHEDGSVFFEPPQCIRDNIELMKNRADSIGEFVSQMCVLGSNDSREYATTLKNLYDEYKYWCKNDLGATPKKKSEFRDALASIHNCNTYTVNSVLSVSQKAHKKQNWVLGIKLADPDVDCLADTTSIRKSLGLPEFQIERTDSEEVSQTKEALGLAS